MHHLRIRSAAKRSCTVIKRKNIRTYFSLLAKDNGHNNQKFWSAVKPFLFDKGTKKFKDIILNDDGKYSLTVRRFQRY